MNDPAKALSYVPVLLSQLDEDGKIMLQEVMQACLEQGEKDLGGSDEERRSR